ncbi:MAG TPA: DUF1194 domain-containing protein [Geminicoccaceae bacterium]|nr:DUF1194 domain-containing protein [Geminicoccaceae bacterium]
MPMPRSGLIAALAVAVGAVGAVRAEDLPVDLELVLAVDISGSIDPWEASQQREGYIAAMADEAVVHAIRSNFHQRIAVAYIEWGGADHQRTVLPWTVIDDRASAEAFAGALAEASAVRAMYTSISHAIDYAVPMFEGNGYAGERQVIDVSGDGPNNRGRPLADARADALAKGITINGLPILNDRTQPWDSPTPVEMQLDKYYAEHVIGGPGAFIVIADDFRAFRDAILSKLIREIAGRDGPTVVRVAAR